MPTVSSSADLDPNVGKQVTLNGRYHIVDTGRHKIAYTKADGSTGMTNKIVQVSLSDGVTVDLWVRPDDEMARLDGKQVNAVGKLIGPGVPEEGVAAPDEAPSLVQIQSVSEAD